MEVLYREVSFPVAGAEGMATRAGSFWIRWYSDFRRGCRPAVGGIVDAVAVAVAVVVVVGRLDVMVVVVAVEAGGLCGTLKSMGDRAAVMAISSEWASGQRRERTG